MGGRTLASLTSGRSHSLLPITEAAGPETKSDALAFALALREARALDADAPLQDALYAERYTRLLPTYGLSSAVSHDVVLGYWLSGGVSVPASAFRRLHQVVGWMSQTDLREVVEAAGFRVATLIPEDIEGPRGSERSDAASEERPQQIEGGFDSAAGSSFELPGRGDLEAFFNEHVVDILRHRSRYEALGIGFPLPILLHGPPGTGKTFAIERLVEFLGWPCYQIDASSIASPYIHDTSRKIAQVFDKAQETAPAVVVIDEVDAFLAEREGSGATHRLEEVAEFLRRIPEATRRDVLVVAMTNRLDLLDPAILRRGRFDHILEVGPAGRDEVSALLASLLSDVPSSGQLAIDKLAYRLSGRPLSDVAFVVREAARLAVRAGKNAIDNESLDAALQASPERGDGQEQRRVGFV